MELFDAILADKIEYLTPSQLNTLLEHKVTLSVKINTIISTNIQQLENGEVLPNLEEFYWAFRLAAMFCDPNTFQWTRRLLQLPVNLIDENLGQSFITEDLKYVLAATAHNNWQELKHDINHKDLDEYVRGACLHALTLMVARGELKRSLVVNDFKVLFNQGLQDQIPELLYRLISACANFWPGECLEEIREIFGLNLADENMTSIDTVLKKLHLGQKACLEKLHQKMEAYCTLAQPVTPPPMSTLNQIFNSPQIAPAMPGRNDPCPCNSGKKYKKCCLQPKMFVETTNISYDKLLPPEIEALPVQEQNKIIEATSLLYEEPEEALKKSMALIEDYPHIPSLYHHVYAAHRLLGHYREAHTWLKKTREQFPDYLFGRLAYADYLLRRGEPEKVEEVFEGTHTLSQLYPDRNVFHVEEWKQFAYLYAKYSIKMGNMQQANIYFQLLKQLDPDSFEANDIQSCIRSHTFLEKLDRLAHKQHKVPS